ncbi:metal-dependent hydrolase [Pedobacter frigiditerrae]|uniref:UPF0173 metal-dependent hydrolase EZ428_17930 n=1 Tax=Pedobacter frigiditerrae TaxID=2530452 RepID=A0A4R0MNX5_9SPHI|nr:metal-dependent hydrolase [Pedobacter frigiditerrae]TCC88521.1 metal-dependent hydrolase [Pedobacter frigiditerrae]
MKLTYYGHSCFAVELGGKKILFDPFITGNELAKDVDVKSIACDYIFISHGHFDHILDAVDIAIHTGATVVANWEIRDWLTKKGVKNTHPMNPGGQWQFEFGKVKCVTAVHSSSMPDGSYGGAPSGFVFKTNKGSFYYSGDTALTKDMELIKAWSSIDLAILPIGDDLTIGAEDAILACKMVGATKAMGVHYDTFALIVIDHQKTIEQFAKEGIELLLPKIGQTIEC